MIQKTTATIAPMSADAYHADHSAVSKSMLWTFRKRVSAYHREYVLGEKPPRKATEEMSIGDLAHAAILEPHRLETDYVAYPASVLAKNGAASTTAAKEFREANELAGRTVLKQQQFDTVATVVESVRAAVGDWFKVPAKVEHAIYWTDPETGIRCKCRPDWFLPAEAPFVLDPKTTGDVTPDAFRHSCEKWGYWLQDDHYSDGVEALTGHRPMFLFVVVETEWPWQCAVYELSAADKAKARDARRDVLNDLMTRRINGNWNDHWQGVVNTLELKPWTFGE